MQARIEPKYQTRPLKDKPETEETQCEMKVAASEAWNQIALKRVQGWRYQSHIDLGGNELLLIFGK